MANLIIKGFPDPLYRFLRIQAALQDSTIKQVVIDIVSAACLRVGAAAAEMEGKDDLQRQYEDAILEIQNEAIRRIMEAQEN